MACLEIRFQIASAPAIQPMPTNNSNRIEVVAGLIFRDGRVLVCQRRGDAAFPLKWEFPGGKIESGESAAGALGRELKEELTIDVLQVAEVFQHVHAYPGGPTVELRFFEILRYSGEVKNQVFEQTAWALPADLAKLDFLDGDRPLIDKLAAAQGAEIVLRGLDRARSAQKPPI